MQNSPEHFVFEKTQIPNENISAIVIAAIRGECATHGNCSQKFHTCKQQKIDS